LNTSNAQLLVVKPFWLRVIAWVCIIFFLACTFFSWRARAGWAPLLFLGFVLLGVFILLFTGTVEMDDDQINYRTSFNTYRIRWDEVTKIELDSQGNSMVFFGDDKQLNVVGPAYWTGKNKGAVNRLIGRQAQRYNIRVEISSKAMYRRMRNTKVRKSQR